MLPRWLCPPGSSPLLNNQWQRISMNTDRAPAPAPAPSGRRGIVAGIVFMFERVMPEPFVLSIGLTLLVILLALGFAPQGDVPTILTSWFDGMFGILAF